VRENIIYRTNEAISIDFNTTELKSCKLLNVEFGVNDLDVIVLTIWQSMTVSGHRHSLASLAPSAKGRSQPRDKEREGRNIVILNISIKSS
jgi:hypothetical protein